MPRIRKKTSKRGTTHQRSKIKHKVAETRKKTKKQAKKNPEWKSKHKKDPGIPNNYPFKEQVIAEAEEAKRQAEEERQKRKEQKAAAKAAAKLGEVQSGPGAKSRPEEENEEPDIPLLRDSDLPTLKEVLDQADVVLQVLDARDPLPFRSSWIEERVNLDPGKRLTFVLNKIDLVPREAAARWNTYLRVEAPTTMLRASSKVLKSDSASINSKSNPQTQESPIGVDALRELLGLWASAKTGKDPLKVAVIGMVNSGKSTIINALKGTDTLPVYSRSRPGSGFATTPYPTRVTLEIQGRTVELIDTPGLMKQNDPNQEKDIRVRDMLLRNKGKVDKIKDPLPAVQYIVSRSSAEDLMLLYSLPAFPDKDTIAFLKALARSRSFIQKKGDLDLTGAAKSLLKDWAGNNFPFHTFPPEQSSSNSSKDKEVEDIYKKFDSVALQGLQTKASLWAGSGLVKFDSAGIDPREVVMTAMASSEKEVELEDEEGEDGDGDFGNDEEEEDSEEDEDSDEGSAVLSENEEEEEEEPVPSAKRKRKEQAEPVERNHKTKKVGFAKEPAKSSQPQRKGQQPPKKMTKVANAKKGTSSNPPGGNEAYDFSKFF